MPKLRDGVVPAAVINNHSMDTRYKMLKDAPPTVSATYGMCENNQPFVVEKTYDVRLTSEGTKNARKNVYETDTARTVDTGGILPDANQGRGHNDYVPVGEYRGFQVAVLFDSFSQTYRATLSREGTYHLDLGTDNFTRMDNVLDKMESLVTERVSRLSEHKKQLKEVTDQIGKAFPKEAEFQAKTARLAVLNAELDTDGKKNEQGGMTQDDTPPVQGNGVKR